MDDVLDRVLAACGGRGGAAQHPRIGGDAAFWYPSVVIAEAHSAVAPIRMFRVDHAPRLFGLTGWGRRTARHPSRLALFRCRVVERFHRTLADEWAYAKDYPSETARRAALPAWLHSYSNHRGHTALGGHPPASRVPNLTGQNT